MATYVTAVLSDAAEGKAAEYEDWYRSTHLPQVLDIPGFGSAQLYRVTTAPGDTFPNAYLTIVHVETDDLEGMLAEMARRGETGEMTLSDSINMDTMSWAVLEPVGGPVEPPAR